MLGTWLSILIPLVLLGFGIWLAVRMIRNRKKGVTCSGGCSGCPYAGSCHAQTGRKNDQKDENNG